MSGTIAVSDRLSTFVLQALGINHGGYCGETIDIDQTLREIVNRANPKGWEIEWIPTEADFSLLALHRPVREGSKRFYISTGVHGDEPAGPLAVKGLIERDEFPSDAECWILPCMNPTGFAANRRENASGIDLNRDYGERRSPEVQAQIEWLKDKGSFDCAVCLHEDWEATGFYLYEINPLKLPSASGSILSAVEGVFPIDKATEIEGFQAEGGLIRPPVDPRVRDVWPESLFLAEHHSRLGYTVESSSDFLLSDRAHALEEAVLAMMRAVSSQE